MEEQKRVSKTGRPVGRPRKDASQRKDAEQFEKFKIKAKRDEVKLSLERSSLNPVPSIAISGTQMSWTTKIPPGPEVKPHTVSGMVDRPFDRKTASSLQGILKELKEARVEKASQISIEALRMSSAIIDEAHGKLLSFGHKQGKTYWGTIVDYVEWCYMQGFAHYDPTDIVRWDARCSDRILSCEVYHLTLLARYLRMTFVELITPIATGEEEHKG